MSLKIFIFLLICLPIGASQFQDKEWLRDHTRMPYMGASALFRLKGDLKLQTDDQTKTLSEAFGTLPNNNKRTEQEKRNFEARLQRDVPTVLAKHIAGFKDYGQARTNTATLSNSDTIFKVCDWASWGSNVSFKDDFYQKLSLYSCVIRRQPDLQPVSELLHSATDYLSSCAEEISKHLPAHKVPYIVGVCGLWSVADEPSKFRARIGHQNCASDLATYFALSYPQATVQPLKSDEFVGIQYSNGTVMLKLSKASALFLKKMYQDQWRFCSRLEEGNNYFSEDQLAKYKTLPLFVQKCIQSNFDIASSANKRKIKDAGKSVKRYLPFVLGFGTWFDYRVGTLLAANILLNGPKLYSLYKSDDQPKGKDILEETKSNTHYEKRKEVEFSVVTSIAGLLLGGLARVFLWATQDISIKIEKPYQFNAESDAK